MSIWDHIEFGREMLKKICVRIVCIERAIPYNAMRTDQYDMAFADLMRDTYINCPILPKLNEQMSPAQDDDEHQIYNVGLSEVTWKSKDHKLPSYDFHFKFLNAHHNLNENDKQTEHLR